LNVSNTYAETQKPFLLKIKNKNEEMSSVSPPDSFVKLVNDLRFFKDHSGSTSETYTKNEALDNVRHKLTENGDILRFLKFKDPQEIATEYSALFDKHKHLVTHFPSARTELAHVHSFLKDLILELLPAMISDFATNYEVVYAARTNELESASSKLREMPHFGVHRLREAFLTFPRSFLTCVLPVECKQKGNLIDAITQALHY
jgi:hypothetical protein